MLDPEKDERMLNPCRFKQVCVNCNVVEMNDRPHMCQEIKCSHYAPCPNCGNNRTLHKIGDKSQCRQCWNAVRDGINETIRRRDDQKADGKTEILDKETNTRRVVNITPPGVCPPELNDSEKEYYAARWEAFKGHYRNPTAYFNCHMIILEEINLNHLSRVKAAARGELQWELSKDITASINIIETLQKLLPEKEAEDVMDDEKSIAMIYEKYIKEKSKRSIGNISRVFTEDALALAPQLQFPVNPRELLLRCGFDIVEFEHLLPQIENVGLSSGKSPEEVLEFFGFRIRDEYAMPFQSPLMDDEDYADDQ